MGGSMTTLWCLGRGDEQNRERGCLNDGARVRRVEDVAHVHGDAPLDARRHGTRVQHLRIRVITINAGDLLGKFLLFKDSVTLTKLIHSNLDWDHKEEDERKRS